MSNAVFYRCRRCGNVVAALVDGGAVPSCCGEPMERLAAGTTDGAHEKHVPVVSREAGRVRVRVGEVEHPMAEAHHIQFVAIASGDALQVRRLHPGEAPEATFAAADDGPLTAYEYCNLHGLWSAEG